MKNNYDYFNDFWNIMDLVGSSGLISITGDNVNLANSGLGVVAIRGSGTASSGTNYSSDAGIYDNYWGGLTNGLVDSSG